MLNAVLSGKAGRLKLADTEAEISWRDMLRQNEDIVTASLFERLSYLSAPCAWDILRRTFRLGLAPYQVATLDKIEFWPRWEDATEGHDKVEPDVFLRWSVGDPSRRIDLIVEAKDGGVQYSDQWNRQQLAYVQWSKDEDKLCDEVFFLALGGVGQSGTVTSTRLMQEIHEKHGDSIEMTCLAASWSELATALAKTPTRETHEEVILRDMIKALSAFGYRHFELSKGMLAQEPLRNASDSMRVLSGFKR